MADDVIGRKRSPRAIIIGFDLDTATRLRALFPTSQIADGPRSVRQAEFDIMVIRGHQVDADPHLYVVAAACGKYGSTEGERANVMLTQAMNTSIASEFRIGSEVPQEARRLIEGPLVEAARSRRRHSHLTWSQKHIPAAKLGIRPMLSTTEPSTLVCEFDRYGGVAKEWAFAQDIVDIVPWVDAAMRHWRQFDPERFPAGPGWDRTTAWMVPTELKAHEAVETAKAQRDDAIKKLDAAIRDTEQQLSDAQATADGGGRRLLTAQGESLVAAVIEALQALGFEVEDWDKVSTASQKLEDLRVYAPGRGWVALAEVKGYTKGGKVNDFQLVQRFVTRYALAEHALPDAGWYIVNHNLKQDPNTRGQALAGADEDVQVFADGEPPGLVIDTVELFKLWRAVAADDLTAEDARTALITATGRFVATV